MEAILKLIADATHYATMATQTVQEIEMLYATARDGLSSNDDKSVQSAIDSLHATIQGNRETLDALRDPEPETEAAKPATKAK